jgi:hypothetical protein
MVFLPGKNQKKECIVCPPIFWAATPVVPSNTKRFFVFEIKKFTSVDFPAPAFQVKYIDFFVFSIIFKAEICSASKESFSKSILSFWLIG